VSETAGTPIGRNSILGKMLSDEEYAKLSSDEEYAKLTLPDGAASTREAVTLALTELRREVDTMPTARVISQWDLISRKAVLERIDAALIDKAVPR
jgi:hypothetical protein